MPGYEVKFVHPLLKRHECPICLFAMRNPVQTECGHLFCTECLEPVLGRKRPICPLDKEEISKDAIFLDNACRREILNLEVYCNFMTSGCTWTRPLKELDSHLGSCEYCEVQCKQCGQYIQQLGIQSHMQFQCPMRPQPCPHCSKEVPYQQMQAHLDKVCREVLHLCPNGCDHEIKMRKPELEKHLSPIGGDCPLSEVECSYKAYGCSFVVSQSLRKNIPIHKEQYMIHHTQLQAKCFLELKQQADKNNAASQHLMERVASLETRMNAVERLQDALEQRVELLDDRRERHVDRYAGRIETVEDHTQKLTNIVTQMQKRIDDIQSGAYGRSYSGLHTSASSGYGTEQRSGVKGATNAAAYGTVTPQRIEDMQLKIDEIDQGVDRCLSNSLDMELRLQLTERATFNGVLLWKIDEFERRRKEAIDGITLSLYSTPFYTSRHGYKMCARVYLNGDGLGKGTHLSFFFVLMRGPFDALLQWPFRQKVTLSLLNQERKKHVTDSFRPDPQSTSFQRPGRREMNVASGCPLFIRIEHLINGGFVKEDTIFLRVIVDTSDLPKVIP